MKLVLDVSTNKKAIYPSENNVVLYDGKKWYITTKQSLMEEYDQHFEQKLKECDKKMEQMTQLEKELAQQMLDLKNVVEAFATLKENN